MELATRARMHAALSDPHRLAMVDALSHSDRTPSELAELVGAPMNLGAHHLRVLEEAGIVERRVSEGDRRRRYVTLRPDRLRGLMSPVPVPRGAILFVCTHNSARSQFAAGLWRRQTGRPADSAGAEPAARVHPGAVKAARRLGVELSTDEPKAYGAVDRAPALVISVCDRAFEAGVPFDAPSLHWSVPDPVADGRAAAFGRAFAEISRRVESLASAGSSV